MAKQMRGLEFEKKAIQNNKEKLPIEACGKEYVCKKCGKNQEIDIAGGGRVAEAKSRNFKGVKNKSAQSQRIKSIQKQFADPSKKPLAKIDNSLPDSGQSAAKYKERGFDVEPL